MKDQELLRYSRQINLPEFGIESQQKLKNASVVIIGMGALGSISSMYLSSAGVGRIFIVDFDEVELSNLQRQVLYNESDIGKLKVDAAKEKLNLINANVEIVSIHDKATRKNINEIISEVDIVLDGTDNFDSRFLINKSCVQNKKPLISAAITAFEGQILTLKGYEKNLPCYECVFPNIGEENNNCVDNGVLAPLPGVIASIQATICLKLITNFSSTTFNEMILFSGKEIDMRKVKLKKDTDCPVCGK